MIDPRVLRAVWTVRAWLWLAMGSMSPAYAACPPHTCCITPGTPGAPSCEKAAGNPINVTSGNKFQREVELPALPGVLGLEIVRYYNSDAAFADEHGIFGRGWRLSYDEQFVISDGGNSLTLYLSDGTHKRYVRRPAQPELDVTLYDTVMPGELPLRTVRTRTGTEYRVTLGGNVHVFNDQRKLVAILAPTGESVTLRRDDAGLLVRVTDPQGRSLELGYPGAKAAAEDGRYRGVQTIDSPVGRFSYTYGSAPPGGRADPDRKYMANLVKVALPSHFEPATGPAKLGAADGVTTSKVSRIYHYEDTRSAGLLTGISVLGQGSDGRQMDERLVTWAYDRHGRGVLSVKGRYDPAKPGIEQVTLKYVQVTAQGGATVLTNSLGQETTYSYVQVRGEPQVTQVRGAGCASCGPVNVQYRYDGQGRMTHEIALDSAGQPMVAQWTEYDLAGRPLRTGITPYTKGRPGQPRWLVRYAYGGDAANPQPILIARPSIVAGKEHTVALSYNEVGQVLKVTESGFSPLDASGAPTNSGQALSRSTGYTYTRINGRSVLSAVDGPLPNGPSGSPLDSDVSRVAWDRTGSFITAMETPGGGRSTLQYIASGLVREVRNEVGAATRFKYEGIGRLARVAATVGQARDPREEFLRYDALGRISEQGQQDGKAAPRAQLAQGFDLADRLVWQASQVGVVTQHVYDTEGRTVREGRFSNAMRQTLDYAFDPQGQLASIRDASGSVYTFDHAEGGRPPRVSDSYGEINPASSVGRGGPSGSLHVVDDFGRTVASGSPDTGKSVHGYDDADRLVWSRDAAGNEARYAYDLRGRIQRQVIKQGINQAETQTHWHYEGSRLVKLEHPTQDELYRYDARGLRISKVTVQKFDGTSQSSITRYEYDQQGTLTAMSLPDGSLIEYERNGQGQVVALRRQRVRTPWLRWALPAQVIVKDLQRDLVGIKRYVAGNGIAAEYVRSSAGVLARVVYRDTQPPREQTQPVWGARVAAPIPTRLSEASATFAVDKMPGALGAGLERHAIFDHRYLWDSRGNLLFQQEGPFTAKSATGYAYDLDSRLIASTNAEAVNRYAYDANGRRVLSQEGVPDGGVMADTQSILYPSDDEFRWAARGDAKVRLKADYDATGQPTKLGAWSYTWDAMGRLLGIRQYHRGIASYAYNHRGERIRKAAGTDITSYLYANSALSAELDARGHITRQYIYLGDIPVAAIDTGRGVELASADDALTAWRDCMEILRGWSVEDRSLVWLHPNHLGAPEGVTNREGQPIWQASYAPFGHARTKSEGFTLNLRLPGQYFDRESGLHYNHHRYYDASMGRYLSPDPLGHPDGPDPYSYVAGNPLKYIDPQGLVLFAFDGTNNTNEKGWLLGKV